MVLKYEKKKHREKKKETKNKKKQLVTRNLSILVYNLQGNFLKVSAIYHFNCI